MHAPFRARPSRNLTIAAAAILVLTHAAPRSADAHPIAPDGIPADFFAPVPGLPNLGHIVAAESGGEMIGEYAWSDTVLDERTDFASPDPGVDLTAFLLTADPTNLSFLAMMQDIVTPFGAGAPLVQIAIDLDGQDGAAETQFAGFADTQVRRDAAWEILIATNCTGSATGTLRVWTNGFGGPAQIGGVAVISTTNDVVEISAPWSLLGLPRPPAQMRVSVAVFRDQGNGDAADIGGNGVSDALDVLTNYGDPGRADNTWAEASDGILDYAFEVFLRENGEVYAPLVITNVLYDPTGTEPDGEWFVLTNVSPIPLDLGLMRLGDEETYDLGEGMESLPPMLINPGTYGILANNADAFFGAYGFDADMAITPGSRPIPATSRYGLWAAGSVAIANGGDELLLLDAHDTILDGIVIEAGSLTGVTGTIAANEGEAIERASVFRDTNSMVADWVVDLCPIDPAKRAPGDCGCGVPDTDGDSDGYSVCLDCNDANFLVHPGATDSTGSGVDEDCDGIELCYVNADGDGYRTNGTIVSLDGACASAGEALASLPAGDCDDSLAQVNPGAAEICDGLDNDCNGASLDGFGEPWLGAVCDGADADLCTEGLESCISGTRTCSDFTGDNLELCDGADNDCDPSSSDGAHEPSLNTDCDGLDLDQCLEGSWTCDAGSLACSDQSDSTFDLCNGLDDDCDPATWDGEVESWFGQPCDGVDTDLCEEGTWTCSTAGERVCAELLPDSLPELCNGIDDDCNPATPDGAQDPAVGQSCDGADTDLCLEGTKFCDFGRLLCSDGTDSTYDLCNGDNDDCDRDTADGSAEVWFGTPCDGSDSDLCEEGMLICSGGAAVCSDDTGDILDLCNGVDDDCDPETADGAGEPLLLGRPCDGPDSDRCEEGTFFCREGDFECSDTSGDDLDLCDGLDNDCAPWSPDGRDEAWFNAPCDGDDLDLCEEGVFHCVEATQTCDDLTADNVELCDMDDNDCDPGTPDGRDELWYDEPCDGLDTDQCEEGWFFCLGGSRLCDDLSESESDACDGADNDCDLATTDGAGESWYGTACDGADNDLCQEGTFACSSGSQVCGDATGDQFEVCDGVDNDCDGGTDDGPDATWYADIDEDGFGDPDAITIACERPTGVIDNDLDCDDLDPLANPDGSEVPCDGADNDCDPLTPDAGDGDRDGTSDCTDDCPADPAKTSPGICGCGVSDADSDGDGAIDCVDPCPADAPDDSDADGVCDSLDVCADGDDLADADADGVPDDCDGCPAAPDADQADADADGWGDACDFCPDVEDPDQADEDADGVGDACDDCPEDGGDVDSTGCPAEPGDSGEDSGDLPDAGGDDADAELPDAAVDAPGDTSDASMPDSDRDAQDVTADPATVPDASADAESPEEGADDSGGDGAGDSGADGSAEDAASDAGDSRGSGSGGEKCGVARSSTGGHGAALWLALLLLVRRRRGGAAPAGA